MGTCYVIEMYNYNTSIANKLLKPVFNFRSKQINMAKMVTNLTELESRNQHIVNLKSASTIEYILIDLIPHSNVI